MALRGVDEPVSVDRAIAPSIRAVAPQAVALKGVDEAVSIERALRGTEKGFGAAAAGAVPIVDLQAADADEQLWRAATTVGFFTLINHGLPATLVDEAFGAAREFFAQPEGAKHVQSPFAARMNSGYEYKSQVRPATGTPDQKESLQITARTAAMDGRWPGHPAGFEGTARTLIDEAHKLAARVLTLLESRACPKVDAGTLAGAHNLWSAGGQCTLRMLHYPPTEAHDPHQSSAPAVWRAGPHTDWDCVTLLFQRAGEAGLECASNPNAPGGVDGGWVAVDPVEGGIAVNIGDMLSRWSDGRLYSNLHRVRLPTPAECMPAPASRYSIAFFMQADKEVLIESETHAPITAGEYILHRIANNF